MNRANFDAIVAVLCAGYLGTPYRWGGDDPMAGFDCSGLVQEILASLGEDPPGDQTAQSLHDHFLARPRRSIALCGSLAFFGSSVGAISHVGFCISPEVMLEAGGGGSATTSLEQAVKQNAYVRLRPISSRRDLVALILPEYRLLFG